MQKHILIIGGMGPQATIDLYQKITDHTAASRDQDAASKFGNFG